MKHETMLIAISLPQAIVRFCKKIWTKKCTLTIADPYEDPGTEIRLKNHRRIRSHEYFVHICYSATFILPFHLAGVESLFCFAFGCSSYVEGDNMMHIFRDKSSSDDTQV